MHAWLKSRIQSFLLELGYIPKVQFDALVDSDKELDQAYQKMAYEIQEIYSKNLSLENLVTAQKDAIAILTNQVSLLNASRAPVQNPNLSNVSWPRLKKILERKDIQESREASRLVQDPRHEEAKN